MCRQMPPRAGVVWGGGGGLGGCNGEGGFPGGLKGGGVRYLRTVGYEAQVLTQLTHRPYPKWFHALLLKSPRGAEHFE